MQEILTLIGFGVVGLGYVFRMESAIARLQDANKKNEEILHIHLTNIDARLARIEKKVLNGD